MKIGRTVRLLTDNKRKELLNDADEKRKIIISIFYKIDENLSETKQAYYMDIFHPRQEEFIQRFAGKKNLAGQKVCEEYLKYININTFNNVPIIKNDILYPIIIYSPGLGMDRDSLIYNIEKLVSEGYIVITLGHIYDADFTILPDGGIIEQANHIANSTFEEKEQLINIRKEDVLFLLDELRILNSKDELIKEKLDLNKIGILGHSLGGAAIFKAALEDTRIKAVVMLDGSLQYFNLTKDILEGKRLNIPFLNFRRGTIDYEEEMKKAIEFNAEKMNGEEFKKRIVMRHQTLLGQIKGQKELYEYLEGYKSFIKLKNSEHLTFTDWPVIYNQEMENDILPIKEAHEIISEITVSFYNEFLCGVEGDYRNFINSNRCPQICIISNDGESIK
ncbi:alpha/beta hydrolase family protein [Candidatus Clostridium radicumherbarum]|uniref:Alpha/beta hydrolase family protein n=1 Tax=Candidatus Clostridium radicumherbarum TaxID=3381662 RepID=A0ABW8TV26_9CLOT